MKLLIASSVDSESLRMQPFSMAHKINLKNISMEKVKFAKYNMQVFIKI